MPKPELKDSEITTQHIKRLEAMAFDFAAMAFDFAAEAGTDNDDATKDLAALNAGLSALKMNRMAEQESENDPDGDYDPV